MATNADDSLEIAKRFVNALSQRDGALLVDLLDDGFVMEAAYPLVPGEDKAGAQRCGPDAARAFFRTVPDSLALMRFNDQVWRTTDDGLVIFEAKGEMKYPDGREYNNLYLWLFKVERSKITWLKEYFSPVIWARANGLTLDDLP